MAEYGFEVSQRGVDLGKAAEWQKVASSRWPYLKIKKAEYFVVPELVDFGKKATIFKHDLGYHSPFLYYIRDDRGGWRLDRSVSIFNDHSQLFTTGIGGTKEVFYILFDYDLDQPTPVDAGKATEQSGSGKVDQGIKALDTSEFTTPDKINSGDYRDFAFNTGAKAISVHRNAKVNVNADMKILVQHDLGYLPSYLFYEYIKPDSGSTPNDCIQIVNNVVKGNSKTLTIQGAQAPLSTSSSYYYVILKEPFAVAL